MKDQLGSILFVPLRPAHYYAAAPRHASTAERRPRDKCPHCGGRLVQTELDGNESDGQLADYHAEELSGQLGNWAICEDCGRSP
jgi:hypothetical protein